MPTTCYHGYELPRLHNGHKITYKKWVLRLRCVCVGGSEQAIASFSHLHEPTRCDQSCCMPLESGASAELAGEAEITVSACRWWILWKSTGSPPGTDDCETHKDCLIDGQCKPPSRQTHWHYITTHPHPVHTATLITTFVKKSLPRAHTHPFPRFSRDREQPIICIWWIMHELRPSKLPKLLILLLCRRLTTFWQLKGYLQSQLLSMVIFIPKQLQTTYIHCWKA